MTKTLTSHQMCIVMVFLDFLPKDLLPVTQIIALQKKNIFKNLRVAVKKRLSWFLSKREGLGLCDKLTSGQASTFNDLFETLDNFLAYKFQNLLLDNFIKVVHGM